MPKKEGKKKKKRNKEEKVTLASVHALECTYQVQPPVFVEDLDIIRSLQNGTIPPRNKERQKKLFYFRVSKAVANA